MTETKKGIVRVTAAVLENDGRIIIARRGAGDHLAGMWELPGGKVEDGESPEQCLARELKEEFNLTVVVGEYLGTSAFRYDHADIELMAYRVQWESGVPTARVHADFRWAAPAELKQYEFAPADLPFIRKLEIGEIVIRSIPATR
jgi:8-oxo-dGTP diphosphatase